MKKKYDKKKEVQKQDDEPSWYHYAIVFLIIIAIGALIYYGIEWHLTSQPSSSNPNINRTSYMYEFDVNDKEFRVEFFDTFDHIEKYPYTIEPSKWDVLNTKEFYVSFLEYNGSDNGVVTKVSTRLFLVLKGVYDFPFEDEHFVKYANITCANSTLEFKVIVLNPYADENKVSFNGENGCIELQSQSIDTFIPVGDLFIYNLLQE